jgi:hypothetical protein
LATALRGVIPPENAKIARPHKTGDLRLNGLDEATTTADVAEAVALVGACTPAEIRVGQLRTAPSGMFSALVQCPLAAANKVAAAGKVRVGWVVSQATLLTQRPVQYFRCLEREHEREGCTSQVDRSGTCYRCGAPDHLAKACTAKNAACPACKAAGRLAGHKIGFPACPAGNKKKGDKRKSLRALPSPQ